jgi:hypothetical protein
MNINFITFINKQSDFRTHFRAFHKIGFVSGRQAIEQLVLIILKAPHVRQIKLHGELFRFVEIRQQLMGKFSLDVRITYE